nr:cation:proton antiporter [candidate division Zixibacteria bacterium]
MPVISLSFGDLPLQVYELLSVGMVILLGLLGGKVFHRFKIPRVTGYMLTGLVLGPSVLGLLSSETLVDIRMVNDIALGLILFAIGGEIELQHLKAMGLRVIYIALAESAGAFAAVFIFSFLISRDWSLAVLLGSISIATAPGVTLLVIREYRGRGPLTDTLLAVVAINNVLCLIVFRLIFAVYSLDQGIELVEIVYELFKELLGSILIGGAVAAAITFWEQKIDDLSELLLVIIGGLLVGIGLAKTIGISHLMVCLIIGAITNNLSMMHRLVYGELRQTEMPFYIAFFVLSGASLHLGELTGLGILGTAYLVMRPAGKYLGSYLAGRRYKAEPQVINNLGMALLPQTGVAIGLVITVSESHPEMGRVIGTVILSSIIVYEGIGPFLTRLALSRAGEIHLQE